MSLALRNTTRSLDVAAGTSNQRLSRHILLNELQGSIRTEVWLGLLEEADALEKVVLIKIFYPHPAGAALDALTAELELAGKLTHENVARTLRVGFEHGRHFVVNEYFEGTTLRTLLRYVALARAHVPDAAVVRVLLALVAAVDHAGGVSASARARSSSRQAIAADDVFITYDGKVKLLGFKGQLAAGQGWNGARVGADNAVDALLSAHLTPALAAILVRAAGNGVRPRDGLWRVGQALQDWQTEELGTDGRSELVTLMSLIPTAVRLESRARLEAAFENARRARQRRIWPQLPLGVEEGSAPVSGIRRNNIDSGASRR
jgi:protein tyrosine kinase